MAEDFFSIPADLSTLPTVDPSTAARNAASVLRRDAPLIQTSELVIIDPGWYGGLPSGAHLAYHIVLAEVPKILEGFFVDAHSGEILDHWSMIEEALSRAVYGFDEFGPFPLPGTLLRGEGDPPSNIGDANRAYDYSGDVYGYYFRAYGRDSLNNFGMPIISTVNYEMNYCSLSSE
jgi:hypothetical protein